MAINTSIRPAKHRRHPLIRAIELVVAAIVILLLIVAVVLAVFLRHGANGQSTLFGKPLYSVASGSMAPTIQTGDMVVDKTVSATAAMHLHKGQIITFRATAAASGGSPLIVTHRIYQVVKPPAAAGVQAVEYRTKGDANNAPDVGLVSPSAILGVYQARIPFGGYVLSSLHQPLTFVILILIPTVYLIEEEIRRRWIALGDQAGRRKRPDEGRQGEPW